jgi:hypothetical protein
MDSQGRSCVLLFSGGRDSSLAAIRLAKLFDRLVLVTIMSPHMSGLGKVYARLDELKRVLESRCEWMLVGETRLAPGGIGDLNLGCIDCHFGYFLTVHSIARQIGGACIACGFVRYQNAWVEQSPYAVESLSQVMRDHGMELVLPVADIASKEEAEAELRASGVSVKSLELKCSRERADPGLTGKPLREIVDNRIAALNAALRTKSAAVEPLEIIQLCERSL